MTSETVLKNEGLQLLTKHLGMVEAERFIALMAREPFDYTEWRRDKFDDVSLEELSAAAMKHVSAKRNM
ncbi:MAG: hypothetical protein FWE48_05125 [Coriobacteriia bacterium]|nr:hypothetical protein [Coriobacteriia bacterium]MCL2870652.1 hypothetical protein [Coriobacteriia bacterium]